jgi:CheY-like chemotaxis protein
VEAPVAKPKLASGRGTVMLVDDEETILDIGTQMLERLGYTVIPANGGRAALEGFFRNGGRVDLVILDMVMPDMGGGETFDRLRASDPGVRVILSSGYSIDGQAEKILRRGCNGFVQKPFTLEQLSVKIAEVLDGAG